MRINEFIVEAGVGDWARKWQYYLTGTGGEKATEIAFQDQFLKKFQQRTKLALDSARASGVQPNPNDIKKIANNFLLMYKWQADAEQEQQLDVLSTEVAEQPNSASINKLGNYLYFIGRQQKGTASGGRTEPSLGGSEDAQLNPSTKQIITSINKYTGSSNLDDLEMIAKTAMAMLYKQNPAAYTKLYREITTGASTDNNPDNDNPNLVRGYNESKKFKKRI